jgi:DNA polymerase III subunit alpha
VDSVVIVTGRLDHKERGQTKLVAQQIESFEPSADELARARAARSTEPIVLQIDAAAFGASLVDELKSLFENFPGESEVRLEMQTRDGLRRLRFGDGYKVRDSAALHAELDALLGAGARAA